ncbi:MAG: ABC transporter permease [Bacteroidota bacterium]|nr:ABC transporter permease [Bacteroidota bacterium]
MLRTLAWRNIWRNRRRSLIIMISIVVGVASAMVSDGLSIGMIRQMLENQIGSHVSHIQIHAKGFHENPVIQTSISDRSRIEKALRGTRGVRNWSRRVNTFGLVSSALGSSGGLIIGVEHEREPAVTSIRASLIEGRYLDGTPHEAVIGRRMAEKLGVGLGDKIVGMASTPNGDVGSDLFRVVGIYQTVSSEFDKMYMFADLTGTQKMLDLDHRVLEYAVTVENLEQVDQVKQQLATTLGAEFEVLSYRDILPMLVYMVDSYGQMMLVVYVVIGLAMIFGIINAMLMSVFERIQEFGVLMAMGMKNSVVFRMVMTEALLLSAMGTAAGLCVGVLAVVTLGAVGIDLGMFTEGLQSFGVGAVIYPRLTVSSILSVIIVIPVTAMLGALYPALKATRLQPVTAIRYV